MIPEDSVNFRTSLSDTDLQGTRSLNWQRRMLAFQP
jgi:hypothetical protein